LEYAQYTLVPKAILFRFTLFYSDPYFTTSHEAQLQRCKNFQRKVTHTMTSM